MRSGGFTVQQPLSTDAATVIKQSVTLARRRGHAQVTPIHVASTMLSSPTGLLRTACLQSQSQSHPLQCKALALCFNVALNRLPASSSGTIFAGPPHHQHPSISNALVAAFKRAQAHQRRGTIENQQQPLLAVKIEIEQLIISILDDPSVSRVMREAGFSSTQVKSNVEQSVSLELCSHQTHLSAPIANETLNENDSSKFVEPSRAAMKDQVVMNEDVMSVIDNLINKRRTRLLIVGEYVESLEGVVRGVMEKVEKEELKRAVKFINFPLFSYGNLPRGEVERKIDELRSMKSYLVDDEQAIVLYLGDLKWIAEYRASNYCREQTSVSNNCYYCPVEHMIVEVGRLVDNGRFWLMGIASLQTYSRCRNGNPSLESVWGLQPLTLPTGSLGLSLVNNDSNVQQDCASKKTRNRYGWLHAEGGEEKDLTCCADCSVKFQSEAQRNTVNSHGQSASSNLPPWLWDEYKRLNTTNDQDYVAIKDLCKKWNSICSSSSHKKPQCYEKTIFTISSPSSSTSCYSYDQQNPDSHYTSQTLWPVFQSPKGFRDSATHLSMHNPETNGRFFNPNSTPNSASSSNIMEMEYTPRFKEFNAENLKTLSSALEKKVPWQIDIIPEIVGTILQCRSGILRRKETRKESDNHHHHHQLIKEDTWFFFQGVDHGRAKDKVARELAKVVFGSHSKLVSISICTFSSTRIDSTEDLRNKTKRDIGQSGCCNYVERFAEAVSINPHRVFFVEDIAQADYCSQMMMKRAIETGKIKNRNGDEVGLFDAIIILSCQSFSSRSRICSTFCTHKSDDGGVQEEKVVEPKERHTYRPRLSLDLNMSFDNGGDEDMCIDDIGLVESVDRCIIFQMQEL